MKNLKKLRYVALLGIVALLISCTGNQQRRIDEKEFCSNLTSFANALDKLVIANEGYDIDAFNKAYDKADREWNKLVRSAERLEDIQMEQSVNAYNKLVNKVNKILADPSNTDAFDEMDSAIQKTSDKLADIQTTVCD